jgi:hypothetical protein
MNPTNNGRIDAQGQDCGTRHPLHPFSCKTTRCQNGPRQESAARAPPQRARALPRRGPGGGRPQRRQPNRRADQILAAHRHSENRCASPRHDTDIPQTPAHTHTHTHTHARTHARTHTHEAHWPAMPTPPRPEGATADSLNACIGIHETRTTCPAASNGDQLPAGQPTSLKCLRHAHSTAPAAL